MIPKKFPFVGQNAGTPPVRQTKLESNRKPAGVTEFLGKPSPARRGAVFAPKLENQTCRSEPTRSGPTPGSERTTESRGRPSPLLAYTHFHFLSDALNCSSHRLEERSRENDPKTFFQRVKFPTEKNRSRESIGKEQSFESYELPRFDSYKEIHSNVCRLNY